MKQTLNEFFGYEKADGSWVRGFSSGNLISQITRLDLLKYREWLINKGRSERTAGNKMLRINQYLRAVQDLKPGEGLVTVKDAKYVEVEPEVYNDDELKKFFKACTQFQFAVFKCLLMAGLRKAELESLTWADIDFGAGTIKVSAKPGFSPKTWEERTIEVPAKLLAILKKLPRKSQWVYGIFRIDSPTSQEPSTKSSTHQDSKKMGIFQLDDVQSLRSVTSTKANAWDRPDLHKVGRDIYDSLRSSGRRGYKNRARRRYVELKQDKLYTPSEVASLLNVPYDTAVRRMQRMKGCVDMGTQTKRYKRGKKMLRISGKNLMAFLRGKTNE
jgi:integrase